jgi:hypothetical protein
MTKICTHTWTGEGRGCCCGTYDISVPHGIDDTPAGSPHDIGSIQLLGPNYKRGVQCQDGQNPPPRGPHDIDSPLVAGPHVIGHIEGCMPTGEVADDTVEVADGTVDAWVL